MNTQIPPRRVGETLTDYVLRLNSAEKKDIPTPPRLPGETYTAWAERSLSLQATQAATASSTVNLYAPSAAGTDNLRAYLSSGSGFTVDTKKGLITNLSILTAGSEATGHGIFIDQKTLSTALAAIQADGGRLRAYITHDHAGPCRGAKNILGDRAIMNEPDSELNIAGFFSNLSIKGNQLVAGKFEFFETFKRYFPAQCEQLMELASKTPDLMGISIEASGKKVYISSDGTESDQPPTHARLLNKGIPSYRIEKLFAAAFVSVPAANKGLAA